MFRMFQRRRHDQLLASFGVIVVAVVTFAFLAMLAGNERAHTEAGVLLSDLDAQLYQIGMIHSRVAGGQQATDEDIIAVAQSRQRIDAVLAELQPLVEDNQILSDLEERSTNYVEALQALIATSRAGALPSGESVEKTRASTAIVGLLMASRDTRANVNAEMAGSRRETWIGYAAAIGVLAASVLAITRLTERRLQRALLEQERMRLDHERNRQFSALVENISDSIIVLDTTGHLLYASPNAEQTLGLPAAQLVGARILDLLHPDDRIDNEQTLRTIVDGGAGAQAVTAVVRVRREDGGWAWIEAVATNRLDVPGVAGIVVNARDITERRRVEEQLRFHALHDPLTGLSNRTVLAEHTAKALERTRRHGSSFAVMFIDLDNFKLINDTWGHGIGDQLLIGFAERLRTALRAGDTAARLGGDEFVLLIEDIAGVADALVVAERVHASLTRPFSTGERQCFTTASIGVFVSDGSDDLTVDDALRYADIAMYRAKHNGRDRTVVYGTSGSQNDTDHLLAASD